MATFIAEPTVPRSARAIDPVTNVNGRMDTRSLAVTFLRVIRSEWVKFRSLQSNWITMLAAAVLLIGIGVLSAAFLSGSIGGGAMAWETRPIRRRPVSAACCSRRSLLGSSVSWRSRASSPAG